MASDRQQFNRASQKYQTLIDSSQVSLPDGPGSITAIMVPYTELTHQPGDKGRSPQDSYEFFEAEGKALATQAQEEGRIADLRLRARVSDFWEVVSNRMVASLVVCGLGNFSSVQVAPPGDEQLAGLASGRRDGWLRWQDLADMAYQANHLKQGRMVQRICGNLNSTVNVPLGWGVVNDHSHIWAPVGTAIYPTDLTHEDNDKIRPITDQRFLGYEAIRTMFPRPERPSHGTLIDALPEPVYQVGAAALRALRATTQDFPSESDS